ncbi:MAG: hypothetical protein R3254_12335, partial [Thiomicrorhabdus sp.]|nr:hypothetical protein [Thiomicrorhabdus sp.]
MKLTNMFFGIITTTAILTTGCSSLTMQQYNGLHTNQTFVLQKPLTIAAGSTRVFIQQGRSMSGSGFNRSEQH